MSDREQFEAWFEEHTGWDAEDYPNKYLLDVCWEAWQASREALKAEQGQDSELLASAKKLEQEVGDIADRLKQSSDSCFIFVPVADLYELQLKSGSPYCYTASSSEAHGWAKEGYPIREYVLLDRLQDAMNHPIDTTPNQYDALGKGER
ncbi:hypothetical protein [Pseudescherichia sp.]|uniref:hypothetical protein n=1 Tax=Pseudescherichia sp. TaxID=2055881 RepID=UPI00289A69E5|nr:hypothetical protein [Pseudescherichia sp.]